MDVGMTENLARFNADLDVSELLLLMPDQIKEGRGEGIETRQWRSTEWHMW